MSFNEEKTNLYLALLAPVLLAVAGAFVYLLIGLNWWGVAASVLAAAGAYYWLLKYFGLKLTRPNFNRPANWPLAGAYLLASGVAAALLLRAATDATIISPWQVVPTSFFALYFLATVLLVFNLRRNNWSQLLLTLHYLLSFGVAVAVYKIGFGFDPFIHRATADFISRHGAVLPKNIYYAGQYALVVIAHKLLWLPLNWLDKLLVPLATALVLPAVWRLVSKKIFPEEPAGRLTTLVALLLPFSFFIVTTPQNLAYLALLIMVLLAVIAEDKLDLLILGLLAIFALLTQPIAGIPACLFAAALIIKHLRLKQKKILYAVIFTLNIILLPAAFYWLEKTQNPQGALSITWQNFNFSWLKLSFPNQESFALNFIYWLDKNSGWLIALLALTGLIIYWRQRKTLPWLNIGQAGALLAAWVLAKLLPFNFLIDYEKDNYTNRLLYLTAIFLLPLILKTIYEFLRRLFQQKYGQQLLWLIFLGLALTAALYINYPRYDHYLNSHSYATSAADLAAVKWINQDGGTNAYIVLANQQVSAAALQLYGFNRYYQNNLFYYPLPTGGPLYQYYLALTKKPTLESVQAAAELAGVKQVYFVLNEYWWKAPQLIEEAKIIATSYQVIAGGKIYIFKFSL